MRVRPPQDRALGERAAALLDGDAISERIGAECRPRYARYKPETSLLVQYDARFGETDVLAHAWLFADSRAARTWHRRSFHRLLERARRRHPHAPLRALYLDDLDVLFEVAPLDSRMPALVRAASARKVARLLGDRALRKRPVEVIRHKPGRKALLRLGGVYLKVYADGASRSRFALVRRIAARGVATARAIADVPELGSVAYAEAPGERLAGLTDTRYRESLPAVAAALRTFHSRDGRPSAERIRVEAAGRAVDSLLPHRRGAGLRLARDIARAIAAYDGETVLTHGDFYDDQVLITPEQTVILDLDEARPGHPLLDVGNFLAHIGTTDRSAFLDACSDAGFDLAGVLAFEAAASLKLAVRPFRHVEPDWPERVEERLDRVAAQLRAADSKLPQLRSLTDPVAARRPLGRALGRPVGIAHVDVLRHKHGRRCTLRYRLDDGVQVLAKTYASPRAARVHESYRRLATSGCVAMPRPLGWDEESRLVATAPVTGEPLRDELPAVEVAEVLYAFHSSGVTLERRHSLEDELAPLADRVERLAAVAPSARRCLDLVRQGQARRWTWRWLPIHRDFYEDQLLISDHGLAVLDLDDAAMSEPAVDVANFVAHLRLRGATARAFVKRYRELDPALDMRLVAFLYGATLLRLAEIHLRPELLRRAERALSSAA
jgi:aminoglycoside phosphotransferase (APT) family kinase protein